METSRSAKAVGRRWGQAILATTFASLATGGLVLGQYLPLHGVGEGIACEFLLEVVCGWRFHVRAGGITGDFLGATQQLTDAAILVALTELRSGCTCLPEPKLPLTVGLTRSTWNNMHEWALAEAVITSATNAAQEQDLSVVDEIVLNVGELQAIDGETFASLVREQLATASAELQTARIRAVKGEAAFECLACKREFFLQDARVGEEEREAIHFVPEMAHAYMHCPACGSPDFRVVRGRGVFIEEISGRR